MKKIYISIFLVILTLSTIPAFSNEIIIKKRQSIQTAIDSAVDGDVISIRPGTYKESIDFKGKKITIKGLGIRTIIKGIKGSPVVSFTNGETSESVLDFVTITGGSAEEGSGILINNSSPTVIRDIIIGNTAESKGSGIYIKNNSSPKIINNLITFNAMSKSGGDPHSVQIDDSSPVITNNTIAYGDSNGIFINSNSNPIIENNILAFNGRRDGDMVRGRGICDFSTSSNIQYNLFFMNVQSALLFSSVDYERIEDAEIALDNPKLNNNVDGNPKFINPGINNFKISSTSNAIDSGNPSEEFNDKNNTRNDIGFTGGPDTLFK